MSMFTLAISCLTTSSLPWFMELTFRVPMPYCCLQHQTLLLSPVTSTTGYCFLLWLHPFILSSVISSLISSSILGTYWTGEFIFQCQIFLPFHTVHRVLKERILKCFAILFSSGPHFVRTLHPSKIIHPSWVALQGMAHSFLELDKAVVHVISLSSLALSKSNLRKFLDRWTYFCVLYLVGVSDFFSVAWKVNIANKDRDLNGLCG